MLGGVYPVPQDLVYTIGLSLWEQHLGACIATTGCTAR